MKISLVESMKLAFCVFAKHVHVAWDNDGVIVPIEASRLETILFDVLSMIKMNNVSSVVIPAGPAPFTQLRILRATQLGLATGLRCAAPMVSMFDVLFAAADLKTGSCLLETRRGDYFSQTRKAGQVMEEGVTVFPDVTDSCATISDDSQLSTVEITQNLAKTMLERDLTLCVNLIYGITPAYKI
jgi:tRNA A37 threonylcarbamoyladenosine modification protein TsaB